MTEDGIPAELVRPGDMADTGPHQVAEFLVEGHDPEGFEVETTPYWSRDMDQLYFHFDIYRDEEKPGRVRRTVRWLNPFHTGEVRQPDYTFRVPIPEHSTLHPDNDDYVLEPELPSLARRKFLKGMGLGTAVAAAGLGGLQLHRERTRSPYREAVEQAERLVEDVRHAREHNTDRSKLYLGSVNTHTYGMGEDGDRLGPVPEEVVGGVLEDGAITIDLVYLDEPLDSDEFLERVVREQAELLADGGEFLGTHHDLPTGVQAHSGGRADGIDVLHHYYAELWETLSGALREGDEYLDRQVRHLDQGILEEAGERVAAEMTRVAGGAVDVSYGVRREPLGLYESRDRKRNELFQEYADDPNQFPVFVTTRPLRGDLKGWGAPRQAVAQLPLGLLLEEGELTRTAYGRSFVDLLLMEAGHGVYRLPHTADRTDSMTYNEQYAFQNWVGGEVMGYGPITEALVERYVNGAVHHGDDGISITPADVDADRADALFRDNNVTYLTDMMDFPVREWEGSYDTGNEVVTLERAEDEGTVTVEAGIDAYISDISWDAEPS